MPSCANSCWKPSISFASASASRSSSSARSRGSPARAVDATRSSSRIFSRQSRCWRTTSSTILRTSGSVRFARSTVNSVMMGKLVSDLPTHETNTTGAASRHRVRAALALLRFPLALLEPPRSPLLRRLEATLLVWRFGDEARYLDRATITIHGDEGQIARVRMAASAGEQLLGLDAHSDLHRRSADVIHTRLHDDQVAEVDGLAEIHAVDRCRDDAGA